MSTVTVQATGQENLDRVSRILAGVDGGLNKALRAAIARTASHIRTVSTKAIRERYAVSGANLRADRNVTVRYKYGNGIQAEVTFRGRKIPLYRYDGARPALPASDPARLVRAYIDGGYRMVHPSLPAYGHQLKSTAPERFDRAFVATMRSGHTGIFERSGGMTSNGREGISEIMGSSVPQMLGSKEVEQRITEEAAAKFDERLEHEVWRILNGYTGS